MNLDLDGKVALVTGGASGIGAAIAAGLARENCDVAIVDAQPNVAEAAAAVTSAGRRVHVIQADVRDHAAAAAQTESVVRALGRLDILVCSAGVTADATLVKMTEAQWDLVIDVNLKGCFNYTQAAARVFKAQGRGAIVNIASINGLRGKFGQANYSASKGGVIALSKSAARELGKYGVNVNVVAPGMVLTAMTKRLDASIRQAAIDESALGRAATPEEIADAVVFLCSQRARHITGEVMQVDGGQYI